MKQMVKNHIILDKFGNRLDLNSENKFTLDGEEIGGGGSGEKLYVHSINFYFESQLNFFISFNIYSKDSTQFTYNTLVQYFKDKRYYGATRIMASGGYSGKPVCAVATVEGAIMSLNVFYLNDTLITNSQVYNAYGFNDVVTEL